MPQLLALFAAAGITPKEALRRSKSPAEDLGLLAEDVTEAQILDAMIEHPILVNRPIVVTAKGVRLCRPTTQVFDLLEVWPKGPFSLEDGTLLIDGQGKRATQ